jgi:choline kinase
MKNSIQTAVILAAGMGRRLKNVMADQPKGFLSFSEKPIIEESILKLTDCGIKDIIIVTGHLEQYYIAFAKKYPNIKLITNEIYDKSGSLYSLCCAKSLIKEDFLLVESDLIYEKRAIEALLNAPQKDCLLLSGITHSNDEVFVSAKDENKIQHLSKKRQEVSEVAGEFVGISKISLSLYKDMLTESDVLFQKDLNYEYDTACLCFLAKRKDIYFTKVDDLIWSEVDNGDHLARARDIIYPKILSKDNLYIKTATREGK